MKHKHIFFISMAIIAITYLLLINFNITGAAIKNIDDIRNDEDKKPGDCWTLEDNKTICYFGKSNVSSGILSEMDNKITQNHKK